MIRYAGIHHLAFATNDIQATIHFWRDLLEMRLLCGYPGPGQYSFQISPASLLTFFDWPGVRTVPYKRHGEPTSGAMHFDHLSIEVADEETLWQIADRLLAADAPMSNTIDHGFIYSVYSYDPNKIPIEFTYNVVGRDLCCHHWLPDTDLPTTTDESADPQPGYWPAPEPIPDEERVLVPGEGICQFQKLFPPHQT